MTHFIFLLLSLGSPAHASWLCEEAASIRDGDTLTLCGIGENADEDLARKAALKSAFAELDLICERSSDCRDRELEIEPLRNDCHQKGGAYKCYRAVRAEITSRKRPAKPAARDAELAAKEESQEKLVTKWRCGYETDDILTRFADLSTPARVKEAVRAATRVPLRLACAGFHFKVMRQLDKAKTSSAVYDDFLLSSVQASGPDDADLDVAVETLGYFHDRGVYDARVWKVALGIFERLPEELMYRQAPYLFHTEIPASGRALQLGRLDELMKDAAAKKVGRPAPIGFDDVFAHLARGLTDSPASRGPWLARAFFAKYFPRVRLADSRRLIESLLRLYELSPDEESRRQTLTWLAKSFTDAEPAGVRPDDLYRFPELVERKLKKTDPETAEGGRITKALVADRQHYFQLTAPVIDRTLAPLTEKHQITRAIDFCVDNGVACPHVVPPAAELKKMLTSQFWDKQVLALSVLARRPELGRALEDDVYRALVDEEEKSERRSHEVITAAIRALIGVPTRDAKKIRRVLKLSLDRRFSYEEALSKLGSLATPAVAEIAEDDRHPQQLTGVTMLRTLAKTDRSAVEALKKLAARPDSGVARAAREALESLP